MIAIDLAARTRLDKRALLLCLIVLFLSATTCQRNTVWKDTETMWRDTVKKAPGKANVKSYKVHFTL
jgi:hypothetical protein